MSSPRPPKRPTNEILARFVCHGCGNCCRGDGFVSLTHEDIERISEFLEMEPPDFLDRYAEFDKPAHEWRLVDQKDEQQSCVFLTNDNRCRIHPVKPTQCAGFPRKWRSENIEEFCHGWRVAAGMDPEEVSQDTMTP